MNPVEHGRSTSTEGRDRRRDADPTRRTRAGDRIADAEAGYTWELTDAGRALVIRHDSERQIQRALTEFCSRRRS